MILEQVQSHPYRPETFINKIIVPHEYVLESDKRKINRILLKELAITYNSNNCGIKKR